MIADNASFALERLLGLCAGDSLVLISDPTADLSVVQALAEAVSACGASHVAISMPAALEMGDDLPAAVAAAVATADAVVLVSSWFPAWVATSGMWRAINEYGTRVLHVDPPHRMVLESGMAEEDVTAIVDNGRVLEERLGAADGLLIVDRAGNELRCSINAGNRHVSLEFPVQFGFTKLPSGVFTVAVTPGSYEGRIVWDAVDGIGAVAGDWIEVEVEQGGVTNVRGRGAGADYVAEKVAVSRAFAQVTEFGVGTNPSVPSRDFLGEDWHEAANRHAGTVHYGLGSAHTASGPAGRVPFHTHLVSLDASVYAMPGRVPLVVSGTIFRDG